MDYFKNIIGYDAIKEELERLADILKGNDSYEKLGVSAPKGLLLYGSPGLGKTLMANCLIKASERPFIICRKDKHNGEFIDFIRESFEKAVEMAPSIILLDDMDKFANSDEGHRDTEEYVTVQSCIDMVKDKNVFVIATANDINNLPKSLKRAGRFDKKIEVFPPGKSDAEKIIAHFMEDKNFDPSVKPKFIASVLGNNSCAELETVINEAALYAGYDRCSTITTDHFIKACMKIIFEIPPDASFKPSNNNSKLAEYIAYHEAGHAVVREILSPGSVTFVTLYNRGSEYEGFTSFSNEDHFPITKYTNRVICGLAGTAATEIIFGLRDSGSSDDIHSSAYYVKNMIANYAMSGFELFGPRNSSEELMYQKEIAIAKAMNQYLTTAKEILCLNIEFLHAVAHKLLEKRILDENDITEIKNNCTITNYKNTANHLFFPDNML